MSHSLSKIYVHIIFSTSGREKFLSPLLASRLWEYLGGICQKLNCHPVIIGGTDDHIHILCELSRTVAVQDLISNLKVISSKWIKKTHPEISYFAWQGGYGAFSVSSSMKNAVADYIANQQEHHRNRSFQEEFEFFLKKYDVVCD